MYPSIISKKEAKEKGFTRYYTGKPCKRGHISERFIYGVCIQCEKDRYYNNRESEIKRITECQKKSKSRKIYDEKYKERRKQLNSVYIKIPEVKERKSNIERNRRARLKNSQGSHTLEQIQELLKKQNNKCVYCKKDIKKKYHADHIMPLYLNGRNEIENIQLLCPKCNLTKNKKHPIDFANQIGLLL